MGFDWVGFLSIIFLCIIGFLLLIWFIVKRQDEIRGRR